MNRKKSLLIPVLLALGLSMAGCDKIPSSQTGLSTQTGVSSSTESSSETASTAQTSSEGATSETTSEEGTVSAESSEESTTVGPVVSSSEEQSSEVPAESSSQEQSSQAPAESSSQEQSSQAPAESSSEAVTSEETQSSEEIQSSEEESSQEQSQETSEEASSSEEESLGYAVYDPTNDRIGKHVSASCFYDAPVLDSIGTKKVLVLPVRMSDAPSFTSSELDTIEKVYNGEPEDTGWQSLKSFYETSSYGKLNLECTVAPVYNAQYSTGSFQSKYNSDSSFFEEFIQTALNNAGKIMNLADYDQNGDGYIDGLQIVYKNDGTSYYNDDTAVWWNFTSVTNFDPGTASKPNPGVYFWSQMSLVQSGYYSKNIDAHTLVHETGHMLGIDDYYDYNDKGAPAGCVDMMDWNVGDHNAVSKSLLGWTTPYVPDGSKDEFTITLRDFQSSGDCLMLIDPTTWNGTVYDEYFMLEYYTPTGLNQSDAVDGYKEWRDYNGGKIYKQPGIKMFHADNRLGKLKYSGWSGYDFQGFTDDFYESGNVFSTIVSSNTKDYSDSGYTKLEIISADGVNHFKNNRYYSNNFGKQSVLFGTSTYGGGSTSFTASTASKILDNKTKMNDNTAIPYGFQIIEQTETEVTIKVSKL